MVVIVDGGWDEMRMGLERELGTKRYLGNESRRDALKRRVGSRVPKPGRLDNVTLRQ